MDNYLESDEELSGDEQLSSFPVPVRLYVGVTCIILGLIFQLLIR